MNIFDHKDHLGDTLHVESTRSKALAGPVLEFSTNGAPWLTPAVSRRLRKVLKAWERSVETKS